VFSLIGGLVPGSSGEVLVSSYCCSSYETVNLFSSLGAFSNILGILCSNQWMTMIIHFRICQALAEPLRRQLYQAPVSKLLLTSAIVSGFGGCICDGSLGGVVSGWSFLQSLLHTLSL
jgi:Na+/H+ antiporter NhaC